MGSSFIYDLVRHIYSEALLTGQESGFPWDISDSRVNCLERVETMGAGRGSLPF